MYFQYICNNIAILSNHRLPAIAWISFNTHMTMLYNAYHPLLLFIRNVKALLSSYVNSETLHIVMLYNLTLMLSSSNSKIYEYEREQRFKPYKATGVCLMTDQFTINSYQNSKQFKVILDAVKSMRPTAIYKIIMLYNWKSIFIMVNIIVEQHCSSYCVSLTKFSGNICILCRKTAPFFQIIYSGPVNVKQYICVLTHTASQRILSEQFRPKSMLSPDKSVKGNSILLNETKYAIFQAITPKTDCLTLTNICRAWCVCISTHNHTHLNFWPKSKSIREFILYLIPNNKIKSTIQLESSMICGSLMESYKTGSNFILLVQQLDVYVAYLNIHCLMSSDLPHPGQMMSHDEYMSIDHMLSNQLTLFSCSLIIYMLKTGSLSRMVPVQMQIIN